MLEPINIEATSLSDAWFQLLYTAVDKGREFIINEGSYKGQKRLEFDHVTVQIKYPDTLPLLPQVPAHYGFPNPVEDDYLDDYLPYLMTGEEKPGEAYTYGQRICRADIPCDYHVTRLFGNIIKKDTDIWIDQKITYIPANAVIKTLNQMELLIWTYKNKGHRNNQMIIQIGQPTDMLLTDPPCLRHIDTRIQDGKLHFFPYFRSWDLYGGFPANLAAIEMMKQYCAAEIGVENGEIIATSKGLHLYDYVFEIAEALRRRKINEN